MSDFLTINLGALTGTASRPQANNDDTPLAGGENSTGQGEDGIKAYPANFDWERELKRRLEANRSLDAESRETEYAIENRFWFEYFNSVFGGTNAKLLMQLGDRLQNDIKVLGFNKQINPILGFLLRPYVQKHLLRTKLLNKTTYAAISISVSKHFIADSEFFNTSNYNIIYCRDLYSKSAKDILKYLEHQARSLPVTSTKYTVEMQNKNKLAFLQLADHEVKTKAELVQTIKTFPKEKLKELSVTNQNAKLNNLELVGALLHVGGGSARSKATVKGDSLESFATKFTGPAKTLAAIQYLNMATGSAKAADALTNPALAKVSMNDLKAATVLVHKVFSKVQLTSEQANMLVDMLLNKLGV